MNIYQNLGYLVLGSRLRRLSEGFISEINKSYQNEGIDFDASWFPVFYLLNKNDTLSIKELSQQTEVSHPAASQLIANLKSKELVTSITSLYDGRKQIIQLTSKGKQLLSEIIPIWDAILKGMEELITENPDCMPLLSAIDVLEKAFKKNPLSERISSKLLISNINE
jgi:DNA-binding MarR family transcriptional regulator